MSSILTNNGAMVALQTMKGINAGLAKTQSEISTGKAVANAKDNAAVWAISKTMESDVASFKGISDSLALGESTVAVARNAAESVADLLKQVKVKVVAAQESNVDRAKIQTDIDALKKQITSVVGSAQFNGLNMVNGSAANPVSIMSSLDRNAAGNVSASKIDVATVDLRWNDGAATPAAAGGLSALFTLDVRPATAAADHDGDSTIESGAAEALGVMDALIKTAVDAASAFGSSEKRITIQKDFVGKLTDAMKTGIGSLVDADMEEASARLQALQVQQQLATQSLSMANQAPQALLSLFRG
ncbi:MAG TPA: flagellin [Paracoccus sp. (in: a-proteobacteria)]|nr:flagellin [Paracoccus sp. (in: a-proteobacteria)]